MKATCLSNETFIDLWKMAYALFPAIDICCCANQSHVQFSAILLLENLNEEMVVVLSPE